MTGTQAARVGQWSSKKEWVHTCPANGKPAYWSSQAKKCPHCGTMRPARPPTDAQRLDLLESLMRGSTEAGYAEVYLSGLRHGTGPAVAYQVETNPNHLGTVSAPTLREAIDRLAEVLLV